MHYCGEGRVGVTGRSGGRARGFDLTGEPLWGLPDGVGNQLAWTVDDGSSPEVVQAYANFARETGTRLTFFVNGMYADSWVPAAATLAPMIASGR